MFRRSSHVDRSDLLVTTLNGQIPNKITFFLARGLMNNRQAVSVLSGNLSFILIYLFFTYIIYLFILYSSLK